MTTQRTPMALILDDPCPRLHLYHYHLLDVHGAAPTTRDGRPLVPDVPDAFLDRFCDVVERHGMRGKFSIVPAPASRGDVVRGIEGAGLEATRAWIETARTRLGGAFDFSPECITHHFAIDLATGARLPENEHDWSQHQTAETLTPYLVRALELLRDAGIEANGFTSPWAFGEAVESEYVAAMAAAQQAVWARDRTWYFLHCLNSEPQSRPWVACADGPTTVVSIPANVGDCIWQAIDSPRCDAAYASEVCDAMLTADGRSGEIVRVLEAGGWPGVLTHWQSLYSNGLETGLAALDLLGQRVAEHLGDRVEWVRCSEMAERTVAAA